MPAGMFLGMTNHDYIVFDLSTLLLSLLRDALDSLFFVTISSKHAEGHTFFRFFL